MPPWSLPLPLWPDDPLGVRKLDWWEAWPGPTGHEPPLAALNRLARIYQCRTTDLINAEDHTSPTPTPLTLAKAMSGPSATPRGPATPLT